MTDQSGHLLVKTPSGLYCPRADVYIDPLLPTRRALITHAHSDHARRGSEHYLTHKIGVPLLRHRLGIGAEQVAGIEYGERVVIGGVSFSFHPAGHVPGSAQILVEYGGERWVVSGDYKLEDDGVSTAFEPVRCHTFISECTFGLPIFTWAPQEEIFSELHTWWRENADNGFSSVVFAYALGKAQRILAHLDRSLGPVLAHSTVASLCQTLRLDLGDYALLESDTVIAKQGALVIAPPSAMGAAWSRRLGEYRTASASGWMAIRGMQRRRGVDKGFVLSDHADFTGLNSAIRDTGAERVYLTHGYTEQFSRWLTESCPGIDSRELDLGLAVGAEATYE
jgi:putative mRNA 3-end processing factor